jgi:beta-hydroxylase
MLAQVFTLKYLLLAAFVASVAYVHFRGRERHRLSRQFADHSTIMAPYNAVMYLFSAVAAKPYADLKHFPELAVLRTNWKIIRDEALKLFDDGHIRAAAKYNDLGFNSFFRRGWKRFYLKWYDDFLPSAKALCPHTAALLAGIPSVNAAMFALLPPGAQLGKHRDPFAGSLRYHLGLVTPNSERCYIVVDGQRYHWKDGEDVMFDETYIHYAENQTDQTRLILFCDVERPLSNPIARAFNRSVGRTMIKAAASQNVEGEHVGVLNKLFGLTIQVGQRIDLLRKRIKEWHRPTYVALKFVLVLGLLYAIFR